MGWKGYETTIDVGMIFKKMYCHKCGNRLKKKKISNTYKKGDPKFSRWLMNNLTIFMDRKEESYYIYKCPNCEAEISYDTQCLVAKLQKIHKSVILDESIEAVKAINRIILLDEKTRNDETITRNDKTINRSLEEPKTFNKILADTYKQTSKTIPTESEKDINPIN